MRTPEFPAVRLRRLRRTAVLRSLVRETRLHPARLLYPLFVRPGTAVREPIPSMPGQFRLSVDALVAEARELADLGIGGVVLFGLPEAKDERGSGAWAADGIVQRAAEALRSAGSTLLIVADVCLHHHEKYDGTGYPNQLKGDEISLFARMAAICDTYDALASKRPHRPALGPAEAVAEMYKLKGHFDESLLTSALVNLVKNAVQASSSGKTVSLTGRGDGVRYVLEVHDEGSGIPTEVQARIFEPFFTTREQGTGLGLPLAKKLIEANRGTLALDSKPGATTFRITLPLG